MQLCVAGLPGVSVAAPPRTAKLTYTRGAGASECPDVDVIRAGVAARLGYEPFDDSAALAVTTTVIRTGRTLEARIEIAGADGKSAAERKLVSRESDCQELASAIELAISIAIDPLAGSRPRPAAPPPPSPPPPPPAPLPPQVIVVREPAAPPALPPPAPRVPIVFQVRLGGLGAVGSEPAAAVGGSVQASARRGSFSLGLEGRGDLASTTALQLNGVAVGDMETSLLMGALVPCASRWVLEGCALLAVGSIRASSHGLDMPQQVSAPFLAVGARVGVELPLGGILSAGVHADLLAPLTELVLRVNGQPVWTSPPISGALGLTMGARFP
ncbi:MAG TPA: hypothetical protein VN903_16575 [Polyangia bacterium]|nr:hypothetical protein [Polyangia bacterium]